MALTQKKKRFSLFGSPPRSPILSPGVGTTFFSSYFPSQDNSTEKKSQAIVDDVRKAVDSLEQLVTAADAYRDLMNKLSKASKAFSNALRDYGNCKGLESKHVMCMQTTSQFYECHAEVLSKLNKALQKDFDLLQRFWDKYSKKATKDDRAHNNYVKDLDKQVKKIGKDYEKKSKKDPTVSLDSHNNYMTSMTAVGTEITRARAEYTEQVIKREKKTHSVVAQVVCRLSEGHFASFNDSLKKCGPSIAKMKEWAPFAGEDMPLPQGLDDFLEDQVNNKAHEDNDHNGRLNIMTEHFTHSTKSTTPQPDRDSTNSEKVPDTFASISEKQLAAMNYSPPESTLPESTLPIINNDSDSNAPTKYVQMPVPKPALPIINNDSDINVPTKYVQMPVPKVITPIVTKPFSPSMIDTQKGSNVGTPEITPSTYPAFPVSPVSPAKQSGNKSASDLLSGFSIGVHADDHPFFRDEKVVEVNAAKLYTENRVEKVTLKPGMTKLKVEEDVGTKTPPKVDGNDNINNIPSVNNKPISVKRYLISETPPPTEGFTISRKAVSDDSNSTVRSNDSTLRDDERNLGEDLEVQEPHEKFVSGKSPDLNISKSNVSKDGLVVVPSIADNIKPLIGKTPKEIKNPKTEELIEEIYCVEQKSNQDEVEQPKVVKLKDEVQFILDIKNEPLDIEIQKNEPPDTEKQNNTQQNKPLNNNEQIIDVKNQDPVVIEKESRTVPSVNTDSLVGSFPTDLPIRLSPLQKPQQTLESCPESDFNLDDRSYNHSPVQSPRLIQESYREENQHKHNLNDHREFVSIRKDDYRELYRHDLPIYEDDRRYGDPNRYPKREIFHRDYDLDYGMHPYGDRRRYDEPIHDPSFDPRYRQRREPDDGYGPSYFNPTRMPILYGRDRSPPRHDPYVYRTYTDSERSGSSVADIRDRFQSMTEERRPLSSPRDFPIPRSGRVSDLTSRFDGMRSDSRNNSPRSIGDYQYNVCGNYRSQNGYRDERYFDQARYGDTSLHDRQCDCYDCRQLGISSPNNVRSTPPPRTYHNDSSKNLR